MTVYRFEAVLQSHEGMNATYVEFPYSTEDEFGTKGRVKVRATFDGVPYRGSLVNMGLQCHCIGVTQAIRKAIGKRAGDAVLVMIRADEDPRTVDMPDDLAEALAGSPEASSFYGSLSYSNQRTYVQWMTGAKRSDTRNKRVADAVRLLAGGRKRPH